MATKTKKKTPIKNKRKPDAVFTAVFEDGVLRPLKKVHLPKHTELIVIIHKQKISWADELHGLCKPKNLTQKEMDEIIESEDWF